LGHTKSGKNSDSPESIRRPEAQKFARLSLIVVQLLSSRAGDGVPEADKYREEWLVAEKSNDCPKPEIGKNGSMDCDCIRGSDLWALPRTKN
jgi:hypothetical protein